MMLLVCLTIAEKHCQIFLNVEPGVNMMQLCDELNQTGSHFGEVKIRER